MDKYAIDPVSGALERYTFDVPTKTLQIHRTIDVTANLEHSKALANNDDETKHGIKQGMWHYGHIPNLLMEKWAIEGVNINNPKELIKMVNKPEYRYLKTTSKTHN